MNKILLIIITLGLVGCSNSIDVPVKTVNKPQPKLPIEERPRLPIVDYSTTNETGEEGIWIQPIGKTGEPTPDMVFHKMKRN
jgi:hypothetical protein